MDTPFVLPSPIERLSIQSLNAMGIEVYMKRDDLIHPQVSGNKWRKLKYNIAKAQQRGSDTLLTLGGAHSNHIAATAAAGAIMGLKTIGIIRGEDADLENPTLSFAASKGMLLQRISRAQFREAGSWDFMDELKAQFGHFYHIPQGGANLLGVMGCMDILKETDIAFDRVFVACGTATTLSGIALNNPRQSMLYGVSALKGGAFLRDEVAAHAKALLQDEETERSVMEHVEILDKYHFGGYAKTTPELIDFMRSFFRETGVKLDPVYTGKCAYAMIDFTGRLKRDNVEVNNEKWLIIHTGGMQGIGAMERKIGTSLYPDC